MPRHNGPSELHPTERARIIQLHDLNIYTIRQISSITGHPRSTVSDTINRWKETKSYESRHRTGRPHALSDRTERRVLREIQKHRHEPYKKIAERVDVDNLHTVAYIALKAGFRRRVARRKPYISKAIAVKRLKWAERNEGNRWDDVVWTDEASLELGENPRRQYVTRRPGEQFLPENIQPTCASGRKSIAVWACIAHGRKGPLVRLEFPSQQGQGGRGNGFTGARYVEQVLKGPLKEFLDKMEAEMGEEVFVVEDGAPSHRSLAAKRARADLGIRSLEHPPKSPDLNCIEPLWIVLKDRISKTRGAYASLKKLWEAAQKVWDEFTIEEIMLYAGSMDERVQAVKDAKGWQTQF